MKVEDVFSMLGIEETQEMVNGVPSIGLSRGVRPRFSPEESAARQEASSRHTEALNRAHYAQMKRRKQRSY